MPASSKSERPSGPFSLQPIGWVSSPYHRRFGTPQQAAAVDSDAEAVLEIDAERIPADAFADLAGVERIWILSWLHRGGTWAPMVRPPRGTRERRSLFATRSPDRPNPIGLSAVRLLRVEGCNLHVRGIDSDRRHTDSGREALRPLCRRLSRFQGRLDRPHPHQRPANCQTLILLRSFGVTGPCSCAVPK